MAGVITAGVGVPLVHIVDATAVPIRARGLRRIGLLVTGDDVDVPVFDSTALHVEAALDLALAGS